MLDHRARYIFRLVSYATFIALVLVLENTAPAESDGGPPFVRGTGEATFNRLTVEPSPPLGADTPMTTILSLPGFVDVLMYCYTHSLASITAGGFAFRNTTSNPIVVSGFGTLQPAEKTGGSGGIAETSNQASMFHVTSHFDQPDRIAIITVSGYVDGGLCRGHAHAISQR